MYTSRVIWIYSYFIAKEKFTECRPNNSSPKSSVAGTHALSAFTVTCVLRPRTRVTESSVLIKSTRHHLLQQNLQNYTLRSNIAKTSTIYIKKWMMVIQPVKHIE